MKSKKENKKAQARTKKRIIWDSVVQVRKSTGMNCNIEPRGPEQIEAYGVKGMQSKSWRKTFNSLEAMNAWVEKNDAEVHGTRTV